MVEGSGCVPDRGDDFRMGVAENGAHLAGREVEHLARRSRVVEIAAARPHRHEAREVAAEAEKMPVGA